MNLEKRLRSADRRAVALGLPADVVLVEFVRFVVFDFHAVPARGESRWKHAHYLAFVLPAGQPDDICMIDLGAADPIDWLIAAFRAGITGEADRNLVKRRPRPTPATRRNVGATLRAAVFDKLVAVLGSRTRLLLAPDGELSRLPFGVLPGTDGRLLVDDYAISYLGCGRDVLRFEAASTGQPSEALIAADPDFDFDGENLHQHSRVSRPSSPSQLKVRFWSRWFGPGRSSDVAETCSVAPVEIVYPSSGRRSRDLDDLKFPVERLPATRVGGERVAAMLGVKPWLGRDVLEGRLKAECRSPRILHLATHGFFIGDQVRGLNQDEGGSKAPGGSGRMSGPPPENPLLRSVLNRSQQTGKWLGA